MQSVIGTRLKQEEALQSINNLSANLIAQKISYVSNKCKSKQEIMFDIAKKNKQVPEDVVATGESNPADRFDFTLSQTELLHVDSKKKVLQPNSNNQIHIEHVEEMLKLDTENDLTDVICQGK